MICFTIIFAILVRLVLLVHSLLVIWLATSITKNNHYWVLAIAQVGMVLEGLVTIVINKGKEWKWFCPCFLFYLFSTIPGIWILELERNDQYLNKKNAVNMTAAAKGLENLEIGGLGTVNIPIQMETNTWVVIMEQLFLYLMILGRWILPRGGISREELSQLLFVFIGIASDITELFALFEEDKVRTDRKLTYAILTIWTVSLLQFTFVLTATHSPKRTSVPIAGPGVYMPEEEEDEEKVGCVARLFMTEVWSICVNFFLQDGPFLTVRMYIMVSLELLTYSIVFFTAKNLLLVLLLIYRLIVVCCGKKKKESDTNSTSTPSSSSKDKLRKIESKESMASRKSGDFDSKPNEKARPVSGNGSVPGMGSRHGSSSASLRNQGGPTPEVYNVPL